MNGELRSGLWVKRWPLSNSSKAWLIVKLEFLAMANKVFKGTGVNVTIDGRCHLGAVLGCRSFTEQYMKEKMDCWLRSVY